jgi:hypothetical protein
MYEVTAAAETWLDGQPSEFIFLSGLQKLEQRAIRSVLNLITMTYKMQLSRIIYYSIIS